MHFVMSGLNQTFKIHLKLLPYYLFYTLIVLLVMNTPFFWDKDVIISKRAFWFTENSFNLNLPNTYDNGYLPVLSLLLAFLWKVFGKSLYTGHLLMLPFALGLIYQLQRFLGFLSPDKRFINFSLILLLTDTVLLSQIVVVSNDLILIFLFFLSLNAIVYNKRNRLYYIILVLSLSHLRGVIACLIVFVFDISYAHLKAKDTGNILRKSFVIIPQYLPAVLIFLAYQIFHYIQTGWIMTHKSSPWAGCFEVVNMRGFLFNTGILLWRLVDFGRVFFWIILIFALAGLLRRKTHIDTNIRLLNILIITSALLLFPEMLIYKVLSSHRYLLPLLLSVTILTTYILFVKSGRPHLAKAVFMILLISMVSGYFWIYPDKIAKGWDSTIAHLPYHHVRKQMIAYIEKEHIPFSEIGSDVPNISPQKYLDLTGDERQFHLKDLDKDRFVFYSNIFNMFTDKEIDDLKNQWTLVKEYRCIQVKAQLYKRPEAGP